jgi:hypothetical protein
LPQSRDLRLDDLILLRIGRQQFQRFAQAAKAAETSPRAAAFCEFCANRVSRWLWISRPHTGHANIVGATWVAQSGQPHSHEAAHTLPQVARGAGTIELARVVPPTTRAALRPANSNVGGTAKSQCRNLGRRSASSSQNTTEARPIGYNSDSAIRGMVLLANKELVFIRQSLHQKVQEPHIRDLYDTTVRPHGLNRPCGAHRRSRSALNGSTACANSRHLFVRRVGTSMKTVILAALVVCVLPAQGLAAAPEVEWIDLLKIVDPVRDALQDAWTRTADGLACDTASAARIGLPWQIDGSYDLEVEFTRTKGAEDVNTLFPVGLRHGCLMLCGFLDQGSISALDVIDGRWATDAAHPARRVPSKLENNHRYKLTLHVRLLAGDRVRVETLLDGQPYLPNWEGRVAALGVRGEWDLPNPKRVGFGVWKSRVVFHTARVKMISGQIEPDYATLSFRNEPSTVAPGTDPLDWIRPAKAPVFRELLTGDDFQQPFDKAAAQIDIPALEKSKRAHASSRIDTITPGGQAEKLGLHLGDCVVSLNGAQAWDDAMDRRGEGQESLTYVTKDGDIRNVQIEPGLIGIGTEFVWLPELLYIRGDRRDPRWDKLVLVAIMTRSTNPDLAETALYRAVAAGYKPDLLAAGIGAEIALEQGRPTVAADFAWEAREADPASPAQVYPQLLYRVAIANFKMQAAARIMDDYYGATLARPKSLRRLAAMHRARIDAERKVAPPSELASQMRRVDLLPRLSSTNPAQAEYLKQLFAHGPPFDFNVPTDHFYAYGLQPKPAVRDLEVVAKFTCRATDSLQNDYGKIFEIGLFQGAPTAGDDIFFSGGSPPLLVAGITAGERNINISHSGLPGTQIYYHDPLVRIDGSQLIELRLVRVGGQAEMFLNHRRVIYAPVDVKHNDVGLLLKIVGATIGVKEFHVNELLPTKP